MSDHGGSTPRRALPPGDDEPARGRAAEGAPRRRLWSAESGAATAGTPIPPPAPVLPEAEDAPASVGRRFSAAERTDEGTRPLPRRSALSPAGSRARSPRSADDEAASGADTGRRRGRQGVRLAVAIVALVVVVGVAIGLALTQNGLPGGEPPVDPAATYLVQSEDLAGLRDGVTWEPVTTATEIGADTPQARCLLPTAELHTKPRSSLVRTFSPTGDEPGAVLHEVDIYRTVEEAEAAWNERVAQLDGCERNTAWLTGGVGVSGLSDAATGVTVVLQDAQAEYHTILVSRTGSRVNVIDGTQRDAAMEPELVATALGAVSTRQCTVDGACPTSVTAASVIAPPTDPLGWLASVDLPRITPGSGTWRGTDVEALALPGTRCEAVDLAAVTNATSTRQRTSLLSDDPAAPTGFGIDQAIYTFATAEEASTFASTLITNTDTCPDRTATAEVTRTGELTGEATGASWVITQRVDPSATTARFRSSVLAEGTRVVYLMANPSATFDFTDEAWQAVATRAGERLTQLP